MSSQANAPTLEIPPPVPNAADVVAVVRGHAGLFESFPHHRPEDVIGCLVHSLITFRGDYLPRGRTLSSDDHRIASIAVFRDFCTHGRDLLLRAGWWPVVWIPDAEGEAYARYLSWESSVLDPALESCAAPSDPRLRSVFTIWWKFVLRNAAAAGKLNRKLLASDMRRALTEAGLRGPDGLAPVSNDDLLGEAALVQLAAERADTRVMYIDGSGRGRISHRAVARAHPNRTQRMRPTSERREVAKALGRRPMAAASTAGGDSALETTLRAERLRRVVRGAETVRSRVADAGIDTRDRLERIRAHAAARGPAASAALAYLLPRHARIGARLSRREAAALVTPPVTVKALRHQEVYIRPFVDALRRTLDSTDEN